MITTLKDWKIYEKKQDKKKDLIIVDVQQEFSKYFTKSYIEDLQKYCLEFARVFQIWDDVSSENPSYDWPNLTMNLKKSYGGELDKSDIEYYVTPDKIEQIEKEFDTKKPGWYFELDNGDVWLYVSDNDTFVSGVKNHTWFYVNKELVDIVKRLGKTDREVILVGGAKNECLYDIEILLKSFGVKYELNDHYIYSNKGCNIPQRIEKEKKVKESFEKFLIESMVKRKEDYEIFNYRSIIDDIWRPIIKESQEFFKINFDLENNDSKKDKRSIFIKRNLRKDQPIKYEFNCELWAAGGDWEMPVLYFKIEAHDTFAKFTKDMPVKYMFDIKKFVNRDEKIQLSDGYVLIPDKDNGNHLVPSKKEGWFTAYTSDIKDYLKSGKITDEDIKKAWKWLNDYLESYVEERHKMLDEPTTSEPMNCEPAQPTDIKESLDFENYLFENELNTNKTLTLWHGGNLEEILDYSKAKSIDRYEYGPGLYLTTSYDVAEKYSKGSRKLYKITIEEGKSLNTSFVKYEDCLNFIKQNAIPTMRSLAIERISKYNRDGLVKAYVLRNILLNSKAIKASKLKELLNFYLDNNIDYDLIDNAFGWHETMIILYNTKKIIKTEIIKSIKDIEEFNLPTEFS